MTVLLRTNLFPSGTQGCYPSLRFPGLRADDCQLWKVGGVEGGEGIGIHLLAAIAAKELASVSSLAHLKLPGETRPRTFLNERYMGLRATQTSRDQTAPRGPACPMPSLQPWRFFSGSFMAKLHLRHGS